MAETTKPCPFDCDVLPLVQSRDRGARYAIHCPSCGVERCGPTRAEAIAAWNRRASPPEAQPPKSYSAHYPKVEVPEAQPGAPTPEPMGAAFCPLDPPCDACLEADMVRERSEPVSSPSPAPATALADMDRIDRPMTAGLPWLQAGDRVRIKDSLDYGTVISAGDTRATVKMDGYECSDTFPLDRLRRVPTAEYFALHSDGQTFSKLTPNASPPTMTNAEYNASEGNIPRNVQPDASPRGEVEERLAKIEGLFNSFNELPEGIPDEDVCWLVSTIQSLRTDKDRVRAALAREKADGDMQILEALAQRDAAHAALRELREKVTAMPKFCPNSPQDYRAIDSGLVLSIIDASLSSLGAPSCDCAASRVLHERTCASLGAEVTEGKR